MMIDARKLTPGAVEALAAAILKQACIDYWTVCAPADGYALPRIRDKRLPDGYRPMTAEEESLYRQRREAGRKRAAAALRRYFDGPVYAMTTDFPPEKLMREIEAKRRHGVKMPYRLQDGL